MTKKGWKSLHPILIPRIVCECGWYNNKPAERLRDTARCKKCGKLIDEEERFKNKIRRLQNEV